MLLADLSRLLADTSSMDVDVVSRLEATRAPLRVHQTLLMARAEVFARMFSSGLREQQQRRVELPVTR